MHSPKKRKAQDGAIPSLYQLVSCDTNSPDRGVQMKIGNSMYFIHRSDKFIWVSHLRLPQARFEIYFIVSMLQGLPLHWGTFR